MRALAASDVLALWERGSTRHGLDRSALLCAWARPDLPAESIVDLPLGTVTESLLRLREASFGSRIPGHVDCTRCGERLQFVLQANELLQPTGDAHYQVEVKGLHVRSPCLRDLAAVADELDPELATLQLLARCSLHGREALNALPNDALQEVEDALEAIDPNADLALEVRCEACGQGGSAQLDIGALLWDELEAHARALLGQVHVLACAYGWSEAEILALSPARRANYLAMVAG